MARQLYQQKHGKRSMPSCRRTENAQSAVFCPQRLKGSRTNLQEHSILQQEQRERQPYRAQDMEH